VEGCKRHAAKEQLRKGAYVGAVSIQSVNEEAFSPSLAESGVIHIGDHRWHCCHPVQLTMTQLTDFFFTS
jgi:hypothetical protein